jgi:TrpR family transcriptional regulator, trp operon repressor
MKQAYFNELISVIVLTQDEKAAKKLLRDILTRGELKTILTRIQLIKLLKAGVPQRDIAKRLGISIAKVTRGSRFLQKHKNAFSEFE